MSTGCYAAPLADFDSDGDLHVAVGNDRTRIYLNGGNGRFKPGPTFGSPSSTRSLTLADLSGDGHTDNPRGQPGVTRRAEWPWGNWTATAAWTS